MAAPVPQPAILKDINRLCERVRVLRSNDAVGNSAQIKAAEGEVRKKWDELRMLRAGAVSPHGIRREGSRLYPRQLA